MIGWGIGHVIECGFQREGYQELLVQLENEDKAKAIHYTDVLPSLRIGDTVLVNTTSLQLKLGSGGFHIVHSILNRAESMKASSDEHPGHMMKLRYTSIQRSVLAVEEEASPYHDLFCRQLDLQSMPVLIGELHSMLPIAACWLRRTRPAENAPRIVYIMTDGGALPITLSNHTALLREDEWVQGTVTYGHAYGGDLETLNKFTALLAARHILHAGVAIVTMGPGIAGTGTILGHTGMEAGEIINAVSVLGGVPVVIPRISFADVRARHRGISHHQLSTLSTVALRKAVLPLPSCLTQEQRDFIVNQLHDSGCLEHHNIQWIDNISQDKVRQCLAQYPERITTMGRGLPEDESFFLSVCAAAEYASNLLRNETDS